MKLNLFALAGLSIANVCFLLAIFIFINSKRKLHRLWALFNLAVSVFGLGDFFAGIARQEVQASLSWKLVIFGITWIAVFFYHVVDEFCHLNNKKLLIGVYLYGIVFSFLALGTNVLVNSLRFVFNQFYYYQAGIGFNVHFSIWVMIVVVAFINLFQYIQNIKGLMLRQGKYLFWGMLLGFLGGVPSAFPSWGIDIYPAWNFLICVYAGIVTYAIFRYQLMDIRVVVTRLGIFIVVYSFILGIPVWIGFKLLGKGLWLFPVACMGFFATIGPFIYLYIQKRAEDRLLMEQRRYQMTLRQASAGMGKIKDLNKLLNMIVYVLTHAIHMEHALIYIYDEKQKKYLLGASQVKSGQKLFTQIIEENSSVVEYFLSNRNPVVLEEISQKVLDAPDSKIVPIERFFISLDAVLIVPIFIDQKLIAIIAMGRKEFGKSYLGDDLAVFSILANQTALAIENAMFYEQMKLTHEQLLQAEKMATIGTMADGLSHQVNNRFHALSFIAGDALDTIQMNKNRVDSPHLKKIMEDLEISFMRVQENVIQGGEIVQGLLKYTRKGEAGMSIVDIQVVFKSALEMTQFKIKTDQLKIVHDYGPGQVPKIRGNFTQLQEVFFNLIDNAYDAMMQRKTENNEEGYHPTLIIRILRYDAHADIILEDNGIGVKDEDKHKLFTPFFTTKLSSKKGTGLGLYVIKKIVEDNHQGQVEMISKYMQGTEIKLRLPVAIA